MWCLHRFLFFLATCCCCAPRISDSHMHKARPCWGVRANMGTWLPVTVADSKQPLSPFTLNSLLSQALIQHKRCVVAHELNTWLGRKFLQNHLPQISAQHGVGHRECHTFPRQVQHLKIHQPFSSVVCGSATTLVGSIIGSSHTPSYPATCNHATWCIPRRVNPAIRNPFSPSINTKTASLHHPQFAYPNSLLQVQA